MTRQWITMGVGVVLAGSAALAQIQLGQNPGQARDTVMAPTGPAEISGVIMSDAETPLPIARAEVRIFAPGSSARTAYTDSQGRFSFTSLPYGRYTVEANKPGYVRLAYGARRYDRQGTPVTVSMAERTHALQMKMVRGSVITGRIVDDFGQPAQGARVTVQAVRTINGERTVTSVPMVSSILGEVVDDRGVFRLFGLPAGDYVISATPRSLGSDIRRMTDAEIAAARQAVAQPSAPVGEAGPPVTVGFSQVYYPGVLSLNDAAVITVGAAEERSGVDFAATLVRTATINGHILTPPGVPPQSVQLFLSPKGGGPSISSGGGGTTMVFTAVSIGATNRRVNPDGTFTYPGVAPGAYTLSASANREGVPLWGAADVTVDGATVDGVTLSLNEGLSVSGTVAFDAEGADEPDNFSRARILFLPQSGNSFQAGLVAGLAAGGNKPQITPEKRFTVGGLTPGPHRVQSTFSTPEANWTLKSAIIKGKDALDVPFELMPGDQIVDAVLTYTNRTQELTGRLSDAQQRPAPEFTIVVFPEDKALWSSQRRIRTARPGTDGRYTVVGLPSGAYRIAAVTDIAPEEVRDQALLEELFAASIAFSIGDGEKKVQDIQINK